MKVLEYYAEHYVMIFDDMGRCVCGLADGIIIGSVALAILFTILGSTYSFPFFTILFLGAFTILLRRYIGRVALTLQGMVGAFSLMSTMATFMPLMNNII